MDALLRDFLRDTLDLWRVRGTVEAGEPPVVAVIALHAGARLWIERHPAGAPFRWAVRCREARAAPESAREKTRACASVAGVLNAMRLALGIDRGTPLRVAAPAIERSPSPLHPDRDENSAHKLAMSHAPNHRTPVSMITGFLGSGKTTLLGRLLSHPAMSGTAVIINEFGEIALDHELVETSTETLVTLANGCLCCKVRSDLTATLMDLAARRAARTVRWFNRVVIETSGLADPAPILHALMSDPDLTFLYELDTVVTTVDAVAGFSTLERHTESLKQVALADRIVLTKTDVSEAQTEAIRARIARINPRVNVIPAVRGDIEPADLFSSRSGDRQSGVLLETPATHYAHPPHEHREDITSASLVRDDPISAVTLALFLSALAENCGADLLRMKGIVAVAEEPDRPAVVHGVQHVYHAPAWLERWPSGDRRTRMVFIARDFRPEWACALLDVMEQEVKETLRVRAHAAA